MKRAKSFLAAMAALLMVIMLTMGCSGGGGSAIQTQPLTDEDMAKAMVVDGRDQHPTDGPTAELLLKIHVYDVDSSSKMAAKTVARQPLGGGPVDYPQEYRNRVTTVKTALRVAGILMYSWDFPVINGDVIARMKGLIPNKTYSITIDAGAGQTEYKIYFYQGKGEVTLLPGDVNYVYIYLYIKETINPQFAISSMPWIFDRNVPLTMHMVSKAPNGTNIDRDFLGSFAYGVFYTGAEIQLYPAQANQVEYTVVGPDNTAYAVRINFSLLELIDGVIVYGYWAAEYTFDASLTIDAHFADQDISVTKYSGLGLVATVVAGTNDARLASTVVRANYYEGAAITTINVNLSEANASPSVITRMYLKDRVTGAILGDVKSSISTLNVFAVSFNLAALNVKEVDLYGDIKSGVPAGTWVANVSVQGVGLVSNNALSGGSPTNAMQTITIVEPAGNLIAQIDAATPASAILIGGSIGNYVAKIAFNSTYEGRTIDRLKLKVPYYFGLSTTAIKVGYRDKADEFKTQTQVFSFSNVKNDEVIATFTGLTIYVPANGRASVDVHIDLSSVGAGAGISGASGAVSLLFDQGFNATGDSGSVMTNTGSIGGVDLTGNTFYVRKSKPSFTMLDTGNDPTVKLLRFSVTADKAGNVDLKQLSVGFKAWGCEISQVYLYDPDTAVQLSIPIDPVADASGWHVAKLVIGTNPNDVLTIGATPKAFEVRGTVIGFNRALGDQILVVFAQDTRPASTVDAAPTMLGDTKIVWSDRSAVSHSINSRDWTNGYLLGYMDGTEVF